jgi:hypothetical protein
MRFTNEYADLQKQLHAQGGYGTSGHKHAARVIDLARRMETRNVMDYGCGQRTLGAALPFAITNYDPFIEGCDAEPAVHDLVVCGDVLEHIEPDCLFDVLIHLHSKVGKTVFIDVATRPAKKVLADGRNAHLIQEVNSWWLEKLTAFFEPIFFHDYSGGFVFVGTPRVLK